MANDSALSRLKAADERTEEYWRLRYQEALASADPKATMQLVVEARQQESDLASVSNKGSSVVLAVCALASAGVFAGWLVCVGRELEWGRGVLTTIIGALITFASGAYASRKEK